MWLNDNVETLLDGSAWAVIRTMSSTSIDWILWWHKAHAVRIRRHTTSTVRVLWAMLIEMAEFARWTSLEVTFGFIFGIIFFEWVLLIPGTYCIHRHFMWFRTLIRFDRFARTWPLESDVRPTQIWYVRRNHSDAGPSTQQRPLSHRAASCRRTQRRQTTEAQNKTIHYIHHADNAHTKAHSMQSKRTHVVLSIHSMTYCGWTAQHKNRWIHAITESKSASLSRLDQYNNSVGWVATMTTTI